MGSDCSECMPGFNDRPWSKATGNDANECVGKCGVSDVSRKWVLINNSCVLNSIQDYFIHSREHLAKNPVIELMS